ncbi:MAG: NifB/NifX family molybdenum-iron cluster-binding protein [Verrucomicrobiota bacterium]
MKIAIPIENGRLHGHFGGCREFALVEVDENQKVALRTEIIAAPGHQPGLFPRWLRERGVQLVIAGGIGHRALANFAHHGIAVRAGAPDTPIEPLVAAYLSGQLTGTPEACNHHGHLHDHEHRHHDHDRTGSCQDSHELLNETKTN